MGHTEHLILGGGLSGLHTALRLSEAGKSFLLLEGRERLGGRIAGDDQDATLDMGPAWFWPHQQRLQALLGELSIPWFKQYGSGDVLYESAPGQLPARHSGAGQAISYRVQDGLGRLVTGLAERLDADRLRLGHTVTDIQRQQERWHLQVTNGDQRASFTASSLIAALPARQLLQAAGDAGWATDGLCAELAAQQTWMSAQAKFVAVYEQAFWREAGLAGDAFSRVGPMVEIHDASDSTGERAALFGFIGLPATTRRSIAPDQLKAACLEQLARLFGDAARSPRLTALKDWATEPLTATSRDLQEMSAHADFKLEAHAKELERLSLHLAGSEFAAGEPGYLEGALEASSRVLTTLAASTA